MVSEAKVAANRANAQKSTGPRSVWGKAVVAGNALRHGVFAQRLLLPGENAAELTRLKCGIVRRLNPRDALEMELVSRIVTVLWKLRRLQNIERALSVRENVIWQAAEYAAIREANGIADGQPLPPEIDWTVNSDQHRDTLERLAQQEHRLESTLNRLLRRMMEVQKQERSGTLDEVAADVIERETAALRADAPGRATADPGPPAAAALRENADAAATPHADVESVLRDEDHAGATKGPGGNVEATTIGAPAASDAAPSDRTTDASPARSKATDSSAPPTPAAISKATAGDPSSAASIPAEHRSLLRRVDRLAEKPSSTSDDAWVMKELWRLANSRDKPWPT